MSHRFVFVLVSFLAVSLLGCGRFDSPPRVLLPEAVDGVLSDPTAPLVVGFHEPIDFDSLKLKVIRYDTDVEGRLGDEDDDPNTELDIIFEHISPLDADVGGSAFLDDTGAQYWISLQTTLPIGPRLAIIIEPGLRDLAGNEWKTRQVLVFGFEFACSDGQPSATFPSGVYFFVVQVDEPLATQIKLFGNLTVDNEYGIYVGQFTNADRDPGLDCAPHGLECADNELCSLLPEPRCVLQSEDATSAHDYPDFIPNATAPTGYSFTIKGCVRDLDDGSVAFGNQPADVIVQSPPVTVKGISFNAGFDFSEDGDYEGEGTFVAEQVFLGTTPSGTGVGTHIDLLIPTDLVPSGVPSPPFSPSDVLADFGITPDDASE